MTDVQNYDQYHFLLIRYSNFHRTVFADGCPRHYFAKLLTGRAEIRTDSEILELLPGDFFYIPKRLIYESLWYPDENDSLSFYSFGCDSLPFNTNEAYLLQKLECSKKVQELFDTMTENMDLTFTEIAHLMLFIAEVKGTMRTCEHENISEETRRALEYMRTHNSYSVRDIAKHCGLSESGIYFLFRKYLNDTPIGVKNEILTGKAIELLKGTDLSIEQIADKLSFSSASYFRRVIEKKTGKTPTRIRREARV